MKPVALITGGTRGIGRGIAQALAREGLSLALCGRRPDPDLSDLSDRSDFSDQSDPSDRSDVLYVQADIGCPDDRTRLVEQVLAHFGHINVLVNNAGIAPRERRDILEATEESFEEVLRVNLQAPYFLAQAVARHMIAQRETNPSFAASIINISSVSATMASLNRGEYCVAKAGLAMATQLWALRLAEYDIPVFEIRPGITKTDMTAGVVDTYDPLIADGLVPQRRWGVPDDIGRAVAALARGDFAFSTGSVINVDGGLSITRL
jgi:NAD(P)-dependent dehydrogenase (short-subunit alcohol dehydrogenase family)